MQIKGKKRLVKQAVVFARTLGVFDFTLKITRKQGYTECIRKPDGSFHINIVPADKYFEMVSLAHEMVHLKQYKRDELVGDCETEITYWKGEKHWPSQFMSDEYFLAPWEMEARALESWLVHKWETRKSELH